MSTPSSSSSLAAPQQLGMMAMAPDLLTPTSCEQANNTKHEVRKQPLGMVKNMRKMVLVVTRS